MSPTVEEEERSSTTSTALTAEVGLLLLSPSPRVQQQPLTTATPIVNDEHHANRANEAEENIVTGSISNQQQRRGVVDNDAASSPSAIQFVDDNNDEANPTSSTSNSTSLVSAILNCLQNHSPPALMEEITSQQRQLEQAYQRCCCPKQFEPATTSITPTTNANSTPTTAREFVLILGPSGSGKTHLVTSTFITKEDGYSDDRRLIQVQFDFLQRTEPYQAFVDAFTDLAKQIIMVEAAAETPLASSTTTTSHNTNNMMPSVETIRQAILEAVGDGVANLTTMIPTLELVIGRASSSNFIEPNNSIISFTTEFGGGDQSRAAMMSSSLANIFRKFIQALCSTLHPLVFLFQNIHWADPSSLDLLASILTDQDCHGAFCIATCDSKNENDEVFLKFLQNLHGNVTLTELRVQNLRKEPLTGLLQQVLHRSQEECLDLCNIIYSQTEGNMLLFIEFTRWLEEEELLRFDRDCQQWRWDKEEIALTIPHDGSVGSFLVEKVERLPVNVKEALQIASCLGSRIDEELLQMAGVDAMQCLNMAAKHGLLVMVDQMQPPQEYRFAHDIMRKAAFSLIPSENRNFFHLMIARRIWHLLDEQNMERHLFALATQFVLSGNLIQDHEEQGAVAALCLHAARRAAKISMFCTALTYLDFGIQLLGPTCWRQHYDLALEMYNAAAEMALCIANFHRMEELLSATLANIDLFRDKLQAHATRIYSLAVRGQQQQAIVEGEAVLNHLGESFPTRWHRLHIQREMANVKSLLKGKSDAMLMRMAPMEDSTKFAVIRILDLMLLSTLIARPSHGAPIILRMMKLTLQYGSSPWTANAFATYGMLCCVMGRVDEGFGFGQLALKVLESSQRREYLPRVYLVVYGCIYARKGSIQDTLAPLQHAHSVALETGDFEFGFVSANFLCMNSLVVGLPLRHVENRLSFFSDMMKKRKQEPTLRIAMVVLQTVHHLMGYTDDPLSPIGDVMDFNVAMDVATEMSHPMIKLAIGLWRSFAAYVFGEYNQLPELLGQWHDRIFNIPNSAIATMAYFLDGLVALMFARIHKNKERRANLRTAYLQIRRFKKWANDCPQNCLDKLFLLEAERASISGNHKVAFQKYTCANALAADSGCLWSQAIANERAGEHHAKHGNSALATSFFLRSCDIWERWGALAKSRRLRTELASNAVLRLYTPETSYAS